MPPVVRALHTLFPTLIGIALVWIGLGLEAGPSAAVIVAGLSVIPLLIGGVIGLRRRRERKDSASAPAEEQEQARETYEFLRWSPVITAVSTPLIAALIVYQLGASVGTGLIVGGLAILVVSGIASERRVLRELRTKAALD